GLSRQRAGRAAELLAEVALDPGADDLAEHQREADQDQQRQAGGGDRDPPADGDALEERQPPAADPAHVAPLSTYPAPRWVCSGRGPPPDSSFRRRFEMKTSMVLVCSNGS